MRPVGLMALRRACCDDWDPDKIASFPSNAGHVKHCQCRSTYAAYTRNFKREHGLVKSSLDHHYAGWEQHMKFRHELGRVGPGAAPWLLLSAICFEYFVL
jgi:hypothetical protein